jgi:hypothetical protein
MYLLRTRHPILVAAKVATEDGYEESRAWRKSSLLVYLQLILSTVRLQFQRPASKFVAFAAHGTFGGMLPDERDYMRELFL